MDGLDFGRDVRITNPDENNHRRARFKSGWNDAAERGKTYGEDTLEELTWNNLGYRFGRILGRASDELQEEMYGLCVEQQRERHGL